MGSYSILPNIISQLSLQYFLERDLYLAGCFQDNTIYRDLPNVDKLAILKVNVNKI